MSLPDLGLYDGWWLSRHAPSGLAPSDLREVAAFINLAGKDWGLTNCTTQRRLAKGDDLRLDRWRVWIDPIRALAVGSPLWMWLKCSWVDVRVNDKSLVVGRAVDLCGEVRLERPLGSDDDLFAAIKCDNDFACAVLADAIARGGVDALLWLSVGSDLHHPVTR